MSALAERDLRLKIAARTDQVLAGTAHARRIDKYELVREILDAWAEARVHELKVVVSFLNEKGMSGSAAE